MVDLNVDVLFDDRLGMQGHAHACGLQHGHVICPVAHRNGFVRRKAECIGDPLQGGNLGVTAQNRAGHFAGQQVVLDDQFIGLMLVKTQFCADIGGEMGEPAGDQCTIGVVLAHGRNQVAAAGHESDAGGDDLADDA